MKNSRFVQSADRILWIIRELFVMTIATAGLILAALPTAIIFGYTIYGAAIPLIGEWAAQYVGYAMAAALETAGVVSSHVAIRSYSEERTGHFYASATIAVVYFLSGVIAIVLFDSGLLMIMGIMAYVVAALIYVGVALYSDMRIKDEKLETLERKEEEKEIDEIEYQRRQAEIERAREFELQKNQQLIEAKVKGKQAEERAKAKVAIAEHSRNGNVSNVSNVSNFSKNTKKEKMQEVYRPGMGPTELAELADVSVGYASKFINGEA